MGSSIYVYYVALFLAKGISSSALSSSPANACFQLNWFGHMNFGHFYPAWVSFDLPEMAGTPTYFVFMARQKGARTISTMARLPANNAKWPKSSGLASWYHHGFMISGLMVVSRGRDGPVDHQPLSLFLSTGLYSPVSLRVRWAWNWVLASRTWMEMMGTWHVVEKPGL